MFSLWTAGAGSWMREGRKKKGGEDSRLHLTYINRRESYRWGADMEKGMKTVEKRCIYKEVE